MALPVCLLACHACIVGRFELKGRVQQHVGESVYTTVSKKAVILCEGEGDPLRGSLVSFVCLLRDSGGKKYLPFSSYFIPCSVLCFPLKGLWSSAVHAA